MNLSKKLLILLSILFLTSCAINRVEVVKSIKDTRSLYKVPVVYGIAIAKESLPLTYNIGTAFAEYNPKTKKGTGSCFGSADKIRISYNSPNYKEPIKDRNIHYQILMVPPGHYVSMWGHPNSKTNKYIKIERGKPQYLGNFVYLKRLNINSNKARVRSNYETIRLPITYSMQEAAKALEEFDINADKLQKTNYTNTDGYATGIICTP